MGTGLGLREDQAGVLEPGELLAQAERPEQLEEQGTGRVGVRLRRVEVAEVEHLMEALAVAEVELEEEVVVARPIV